MTYTNEMPKIDLDVLAQVLGADDLEVARRIVSTQGKNAGRLRASKPKNEMKRQEGGRFGWQMVPVDMTQARAAYVWRMVAFYVSPKSQHQCMPCTADFALGPYSETRDLIADLDKLVDQIVNTIPREQWAGVRRWAQVFGKTGQPQVTPDGAIIYR